MPILEVAGGQVDLFEIGAGRPLVLLHSLLADRTVFDPILPRLSSTRRIIVPTLPGFGLSSRAGQTAFEVADRIVQLLAIMNLGDEADVLGNGFGAFVAAAIGIRHGDKIRRLVLSNCGATFDENGRAAFRTMALRASQAGMPALVEVAMNRLFPADFMASRPDVIGARRAAFLTIDPAFFAAVCNGLAKLDLREAAAQINNPSLIIAGDRDTATPPEMGRALAGLIRGAQFVELVGLGHAPMVQDPERFVDVLLDFIDSDAPPRAGAALGGSDFGMESKSRNA
jgi:3-oxoadipate enol-lactonase